MPNKVEWRAVFEIMVQVTPSKSHGIKNFVSKFFSYHKNQMLLYEDFGFIWLKLKFLYQKQVNFSIFLFSGKNSEN